MFVLINPSHGLKESDKLMLKDLHNLSLDATASLSSRVQPFSFQVVLTKLDEVLKGKQVPPNLLHSIQSQIQQLAPTCMPNLILTSTKISTPDSKLGINELRECIVEAGVLT